MTAKPTVLPRWANVGGSIVTPSSSKQDVGWLTAERPPAQYMNWLNKNGYDWFAFTNTLLTNNGGAVGAMDLGNDVEGTVLPIASWRDYLGKVRAKIDHNGYRMGQVSEIEEHWALKPITINLSLYAATVTGATKTGFLQIKFTANSQSASVPISGAVPIGALITSVLVRLNRTTGTDSISLTLEVGSQATGDAATSPAITATSTAGTGAASVEMLSGGKTLIVEGTTAGQSGAGMISLTWFQTAITTADWLTDIEVTYVIPPPGWLTSFNSYGTANPGDRYAYVDPDANINHRSIQLLGQVQSAAQSKMELFGPWEAFMNADVAWAGEFMIRTGTISDGSNARNFAAGIQNNNAGGLNRFIYLFNSNTTANWQLRVVGSSTTDTDTGVAIAANTTYRVRLEIYGQNTSSAAAGSFRVRLYINGSLVANVTNANMPAADMIRPYFIAGTTGTAGGPYDLRVGRLRRVHAHLLTADNL